MVTKQQRDSRGRFVTGNGRSKIGAADLLANLVGNAAMSRASLMRASLDPKKSIDDECGYPTTQDITAKTYRELYDRESIATRVVQVLPKETWQAQPSVFETEDLDQVTEFEKMWGELGKGLRGESWYVGEQGSLVWEYLKRVDELSGIGSYGVLLLGVDDGKELSEQVEPGTGRKLLFLRAFDESLAQITRYETDVNNPRFGQPTQYSLSFADHENAGQGAFGTPLITKQVHWTRVIHVADNLGSSEILGVPRMRPVFNRLLDLRKLYGGSAEMYWRGAFPGLSIETDPKMGSDVELDMSSVKDALEQYMNGLQRYLALTGVSAKSLAPQVVDPSQQIDVQLTAICILIAVPKRIFVGSERGELASSQDKGAWNDRLQDRQNIYVTPRIIVPFVDRLIMVGVLPQPKEYSVVWGDIGSLSEDEQATIAVKRTEAMAKYVQGSVEALMPPMDYLTRVQGMTNGEAEAVIEAAMNAVSILPEPEELEVVTGKPKPKAKEEE